MSTRRFVAIMLALALLTIGAGCGSDPQPTPVSPETPVPQPTPSPTPEPTPTPVVEPAGSLEDFFLTETTTGAELMSRLSQGEQDCVRQAIGEATYTAFLGIPVRRVIGETGAGGARSFLGCLTEDNLLLMGLVLIDDNAGRSDPGARPCQIAVARANPVFIHVRFELLRPELETIDSEALFASAKAAFDCLNVADQADVLVRLTTRLDQEDTFTGQDIVSMLSETEAACIRERVGEEQFEIFLSATVTEAFTPSLDLLDCLGTESKVAIFTAFTASRVDGLREEALACMAGIVAESPNILALGFGTLDPDEMEESELAQLGTEAARLFDCLNEDELLKVLTLPAVVEQ